MKVTFNKNELTSALDRVQRAAQTKINSNTNNGFFISAANGIVEFQANDYTIGIKTTCSADIFEDGVAVIAAPQLQSTLRMMPSGDIVMEMGKGENTVSFKSGSYFSKFLSEIPRISRKSRKWIIRIMQSSAARISLTWSASSSLQQPLINRSLSLQAYF